MLAIVIPYFKLQFFEETLQSLAGQTNKDFTVYIGDDASPQDCRPLLKQFEGKFSFLYKRFDTNLGSTSLTQQWHRCIDLIVDDSVEWVMLLGDDDILENEVVETFYKNYNQFKEITKVVRYATKELNQIENTESSIFLNPIFESGFDFLNRKLNGLTRASLSEFVFKWNDLKNNKFTDYSSAFFSDDRIVLDLSLHNNIYSINESVITIRIFEESISGKASSNYENLSKARFNFYFYLVTRYYNYLNKTSKIKVLDFLIGYGLKFDKLKIYDLLNFYIKSIFLLNINFFIKVNKKIIRSKLRMYNFFN